MRCGWFETHPETDIMPMMSESEMDSLVASMCESGYDPSKPIVLHEGKILDGRNRYKAARRAGIAHHEIPTVKWDGQCGDPLSYVEATNLHRRHLDESQRALVAARIRDMRGVKHGGDRTASATNSTCQTDESLAERYDVSKASIRNAHDVIKHAPDLVPKIEAGELKVTPAAKEARQRKRKKAPPKPVDMAADNVDPGNPLGEVIDFQREAVRAEAERIIAFLVAADRPLYDHIIGEANLRRKAAK